MPFSRLRKGAFCIFLNPRLNGKPGVVHLYWQLMALRSSYAPDTTEEVTESQFGVNSIKTMDSVQKKFRNQEFLYGISFICVLGENKAFL